MAKKEKIAIHRDKTLEPIDLELDAAMGLLDDANKQICDLLTSLDANGTPAGEGAVKVAEAPVVYAEVNEDGEPIEPQAETPQVSGEPPQEEEKA